MRKALTASFCASGKQLDALLGGRIIQVVEQRFRPVLQQAVKLLVDLVEDGHAAGPQVLLLRAEVAVRADRRGVQVVLDQREARLDLGQPD